MTGEVRSAGVQLGIVIPTVERTDMLRRALDRLERQQVPRGVFEVGVIHGPGVDADAIEAAIGERTYEVRRLVSEKGDASSNRNHGWRSLGTPLILFLDDDVLASRQLVGEHLAAHARWPEPQVGILGHVRWARWPRPTAFMRWLEQGMQFDFRGLRAGQEAEWWRFYTANASLKRELLEGVGGFDSDRFPFGYEDLDLAARMGEHGFRLRYVPTAEAEHLHPQNLDDWRERVWRIAASEWSFHERHSQFPPYFHDLFVAAAASPSARGRGARLAGLVPSATPWLGPRVWASFDLWHRQQLAPEFLKAWDAASASR